MSPIGFRRIEYTFFYLFYGDWIKKRHATIKLHQYVSL